jgi:hypothetical protein
MVHLVLAWRTHHTALVRVGSRFLNGIGFAFAMRQSFLVGESSLFFSAEIPFVDRDGTGQRTAAFYS